MFRREYEALCSAAEQGEPTLLDEYGAGSPSEFFAVVTEAFFEAPRSLAGRHPGLYEALRGFYKVDPARWSA